jgi:hypothetical protein
MSSSSFFRPSDFNRGFDRGADKQQFYFEGMGSDDESFLRNTIRIWR